MSYGIDSQDLGSVVGASLWVFFEGIAYTGNCNDEASDNLLGTTKC